MSELIRLADRRTPDQPGHADAESSVSTIIAHLHRLADAATSQNGPSPTSPDFVRKVIAARAARRQYFTADLFADPAWDILLELYALECEQHRTSVSKLCMAAAVPATTALRWIDKLHAEGLIMRSADPLDARRVWVSTSATGFSSMKAYLQDLSAGSMPL